MGVLSEVRAKWSFGLQAGAGGQATGSTGTGTRLNVDGLGRENIFYIETPAATTCSYQILVARTQTGATHILSSGTMAASALDLIHVTGPLAWVAPRIKTLTDTTTTVVVELYGN